MSSGNRRPGGRQQGFALLVTLLVLVLAGTAFFFGTSDPGTLARSREGIVASERLRTAADAVAAYAAFGGSGPGAVPGALPCPDYHDPDGADAGNASPLRCINQTRPVYLQRFPWRTIDTSRELAGFWYAIDGRFRDDALDVVPLNPDTATGTLTVDGVGAYAAVVIKSSTTAGAPAAVLAPENADGDKAFVDCTDDPDCDDRARGVSSARIFALVRQRVPAAVRRGLDDFFNRHGYYPWPAALSTSDWSCRNPGALPPRGNLPLSAGTCGEFLDAHTSSDHLPGDPDPFDPMPEWLEDNDWHEIIPIYYAVASECTPGGGVCDGSASGLLTLSGDSEKAVIFGDAGRPIVSTAKADLQDRSGSPPHDVIEYLDSIANTDGNDIFNDPDNGNGENDRLFSISASSP